jgi:hypothetical protein
MSSARQASSNAAVGDALAKEGDVFLRKRVQLLNRYEGQFVAIYQGKVAGHHLSDEVLARTMFDTFGDVPFYIAKVERTPSVIELPSPGALRPTVPTCCWVVMC